MVVRMVCEAECCRPRIKTDLFVHETTASHDSMEHTALYYGDKIADYTAWAETTARKLYTDALAGTIT